jgi:hypothetical protein
MSYNASTSKYRSTIKHMFLALVQERTLTQVFKKENGSVIKVEQTWTISFCLYFKSVSVLYWWLSCLEEFIVLLLNMKYNLSYMMW